MKNNVIKNNSGFAITSFLYAILVIFLIFFSLLLVNIINSKLTLENLKSNVKDKLDAQYVEGDIYAELFVEDEELNIAIGDNINLLDGVYLKRYDDIVLETEISYESTPEFDITQIGTYTINYMTTFNGKTYTASKIVNITD